MSQIATVSLALLERIEREAIHQARIAAGTLRIGAPIRKES